MLSQIQNGVCPIFRPNRELWLVGSQQETIHQNITPPWGSIKILVCDIFAIKVIIDYICNFFFSKTACLS